MKLRNYLHPHHLCFQSKVGPAKWLEPSTDTND
jgi:protoheme ferro-lyase